MQLRTTVLNENKIRAIAGLLDLEPLFNGTKHLSRGEFGGGLNISFRLGLVEPTPKDKTKTAKYQRRGHEGGRIRAVCWHGYRDFMIEMFRLDPNARLTTGAADYRGQDGFERLFQATGDRNIGSMIEPLCYRDACDCEEENHAVPDPRQPLIGEPQSRVVVLNQSDIMACPHVIMSPEHYREDGSCRCNDLMHTVMAEWGYHWSAEERSWT